MLRPFFFSTALILLVGCADYANRTYRYGEEVPVKPFVFKLEKVEYAVKDQTVILKAFLEVSNRSQDKNTLSRQRFSLRVGKDREVARDSTFLEAIGVDTTGFSPGESATLLDRDETWLSPSFPACPGRATYGTLPELGMSPHLYEKEKNTSQTQCRHFQLDADLLSIR